jgi:N-acetylneuraminic acid mutarotase
MMVPGGKELIKYLYQGFFNLLKKIKKHRIIMKVIIFLMFTIFVNLNSKAQIWSDGPDIPIPVRAANTSIYNAGDTSWIFLVSGRSLNDLMTKKVQRLNTVSLTWDTVTSHPTGMLGAATAVLGDSLYCIGGVINPPGAGTSTVWKYNIKENTWGTAADFPFITGDAKAVSYQDSIIIIAGGYTSTTNGMVYLYNSNTNSWRAGTPIPSPTGLVFGGFTISGDTLVYLCGTSAFGSPIIYNTIYLGVIDQNDRSNISWSVGTGFPGTTRSFFDANTWRNGIIMTGGSSDNSLNSFSSECYTYNLGTDEWTELPDKPTPWVTGQSSSVVTANGEWKLFCISGYGSSGYLYEVEILSDQLTDLNNEKEEGMLIEYKINAYPNPFNNQTKIRFSLAEKGKVHITIYDILGNEIKNLFNSEKESGTFELSWNGINNSGKDVSSGVYYARMIVEDESINIIQSTKIILMK